MGRERRQPQPILRAYQPSEHDARVAVVEVRAVAAVERSLRHIARKLGHDPGALLALEADGRLAGSVMVGYDGHCGGVNHLAADPAYQGRGLGGLFMGEAGATAYRAGGAKVDLQVRTSNEHAAAFCGHLGYGIHGVVNRANACRTMSCPGSRRASNRYTGRA